MITLKHQAGERAGPNVVILNVDHRGEVLFSMRLVYDVTMVASASWSFPHLDFGKVALKTDDICREVRLIVRLPGIGEESSIPLQLHAESENLDTKVKSQATARGRFGEPVLEYVVECTLNARDLAPGPHHTDLIAICQTVEARLAVAWEVAPELEHFPAEATILIDDSSESTVSRLHLRSWGNRSFSVESVSCDIVGVEVYPEEGLTFAKNHTLSLTARRLNSSAESSVLGYVRYRIKWEDGSVDDRETPCKLKHL